MAHPPGFLPLSAITENMGKEVSVMGVVTSFEPLRFTAKGDIKLVFYIEDSSFTYTPIEVRFFYKEQDRLPTVRGTGDVVILHKIKVITWSSVPTLLASWSTTWTVFAASNVPPGASPASQSFPYNTSDQRKRISSAEYAYAIDICNSRDRSTFTLPVEPPKLERPSTATCIVVRERFSLIKDVQVNCYYDLVGQVVKIFAGDGKCELYVTDYTSNDNLYHYALAGEACKEEETEGQLSEFAPLKKRRTPADTEWRGPYGKLTLPLVLWPPHAEFARENLKANDWISLKNVRIKMSQMGYFEGALHTDQTYRDKVGISHLELTNDRVKDVLRRKKEYEDRVKVQKRQYYEVLDGRKRKLGPKDDREPKGRPKKKSKAKGKILSANLEKSSFMDVTNYHNNKHVRARDPERSFTSLAHLVQRSQDEVRSAGGKSWHLPFQNLQSRHRVRVVDFFPPRIEDFAVPYAHSEYDVLSDYEGDLELDVSSLDKTNSDSDIIWRWRFCLLLEDASPDSSRREGKIRGMKVIVADEDAEYLLKLDATNLRRNPAALAKLREQLFILWGDLEEKKSIPVLQADDAHERSGQMKTNNSVIKRQVSGVPFDCCLRAYGVRIQSEKENEEVYWGRRWRMFGTTII